REPHVSMATTSSNRNYLFFSPVMRTDIRQNYSALRGINREASSLHPRRIHPMKHTSAQQHLETAEPAEAAPAANDGIDRRSFLSCMAWVGTGIVWTMAGGVPTSRLFAATGNALPGKSAAAKGSAEFSFVQI